MIFAKFARTMRTRCSQNWMGCLKRLLSLAQDVLATNPVPLTRSAASELAITMSEDMKL